MRLDSVWPIIPFKLKRHLFSFMTLLVSSLSYGTESICYGTTSNGSLQNGVQLPRKGPNYIGYSDIARFAGRTFVHSTVKTIFIDAYKNLEKTEPDKVFKYAETGLAEGGLFKPHKTHQNGLSIDFMTPVMDQTGNSVHLPTHLFNKFGYSIEFNQADKYDNFRIDYSALAAHLVALHKSAKKHHAEIWRVIFDPFLH